MCFDMGAALHDCIYRTARLKLGVARYIYCTILSRPQPWVVAGLLRVTDFK